MTNIQCKCGGTDFTEILDGQWTKTYWEWNENAKTYKKVNEKIDGNGDHYFECSDCGERLEEDQSDNFMTILLKQGLNES